MLLIGLIYMFLCVILLFFYIALPVWMEWDTQSTSKTRELIL